MLKICASDLFTSSFTRILLSKPVKEHETLNTFENDMLSD